MSWKSLCLTEDDGIAAWESVNGKQEVVDIFRGKMVQNFCEWARWRVFAKRTAVLRRIGAIEPTPPGPNSLTKTFHYAVPSAESSWLTVSSTPS